jgi:predicted RNA binding protein YcfA (HicA-like mRNA interferase family)
MDKLPSMKAGELERLLTTVLGYEIARQAGSHRVLKADGRPTLTFAFHAGQTVGPRMVRKVLKDAGLSDEEIEDLL